jgi:hypothetical protein
MAGFGGNIDVRQKKLTPGRYVKCGIGYDPEGGFTTVSSHKGLI